MQRDYLLVCSYCDEYTLLGRYLPKEGRFQGEHSILHNRHIESDVLLGKFLLAHVGHPVRLLPDRTDEYVSALVRLHRFAEDDIDRYVEESAQQAAQQAQDRQFDRSLGQLQLLIYRSLLSQEAEAVSRAPSLSSQDAQYLLGKQQGLEWAAQQLDEVLRRG